MLTVALILLYDIAKFVACIGWIGEYKMKRSGEDNVKKITILSVLLLFVLATGVHAAIIDYDFRVDPWMSNVDGQTAYYYDGLEVSTSNGVLTWNGSDGTFEPDGIGIAYSYEYDEIEGDETLTLTFDNSVYIESILLTDFFYELNNNGTGSFQEEGSYRIDGGSWVDIIAPDGNLPTPETNGLYEFFPSTIGKVIEFQALGYSDSRLEDHEFSVAQIKVSPVPEPATMLLLGCGLIGLAGVRRKKFKN